MGSHRQDHEKKMQERFEAHVRQMEQSCQMLETSIQKQATVIAEKKNVQEVRLDEQAGSGVERSGGRLQCRRKPSLCRSYWLLSEASSSARPASSWCRQFGPARLICG